MSPNSSPDFSQFQKDIGKWRRHNFPDQKPHQPLIGIVEEMGEMLDALHTGNRSIALDSIGDAVIYTLNYCDQRGFEITQQDMLHEMSARDGEDMEAMDLFRALGQLAHAHLKGEQGIRGTAEEHKEAAKKAIIRFFLYLIAFCEAGGFSIEKASKEAWDEVSKRDWIKFPFDGRTK